MPNVASMLRRGQLEAIEDMHNGCILCGDVGSGKSRTALAYYYKENGGDMFSEDYSPMDDPPRDLYIITTAHKRDLLEWDSEMAPFLMSTHPDTNLYTNKIIVDSWNNIKKYSNITGAFFIFDEQRVVGTGAWVKAFIRIARRNRWILLSATPGDTWSDYAPVFIANGFYDNITSFRREHVVYKSFRNYPIIDHYVGTGKLIKQRKQILVDIPVERETIQHHEDIFVTYDVAAYRAISRERWNPWTDMPIKNSSEYCQCLRKVVNTSEGRQVATLEWFEDHPKTIIFYNYDYELEILRALYYGADVQIAEWNGHKHEPVPKSSRWVYLVQYTAGAEGWNCITTDAMLFYSQTYSYKVLKQAAGRIDRLSTPFKDLYYGHIRSRSGIDLAIHRALVEKRDFNERDYASGEVVRWAIPIIKAIQK